MYHATFETITFENAVRELDRHLDKFPNVLSLIRIGRGDKGECYLEIMHTSEEELVEARKSHLN